MEKGEYRSAFLLSGPSGVGKTTVGRIFSKSVLCSNPVGGDPCGTCSSCISFDNETNFSYRELDSASFGGKDEMVKIRDEASVESLGKKKIILLDECHDISKQGQDALLKQIEECPEHLIYVFCTTDPDKIKTTLRSRCMEFQFSKVSSSEIVGLLRGICKNEGIDFDDESLSEVAHRTGGHVRNAVSLIEEISYLGAINLDNLNKILPFYDKDICDIICALGSNISLILQYGEKILGKISVLDFYNIFIGLLTDTAKFLSGFEDFPPVRLEFLRRIREIHGSLVIPFLQYLLQRDKFIDKTGIIPDLIILHNKCISNSFRVSSAIDNIYLSPPPSPNASDSSSEIGSKLTSEQLMKLSSLERAKYLRAVNKKRTHKVTGVIQKVPFNWSLPKEERIGCQNQDGELSSLAFSHLMVGGRGEESG